MDSLLNALVKQKIITPQLAERIQKESEVLDRRIEDLLYERKLVDEKTVAKLKGEIFNLPTKFLGKDETIPSEILNLISEDAAKNYNLVVLGKTPEALLVGMLYPDDAKAQQALRFISQQLGQELKIFVVTPSDLQRAWKGYRIFASEIEEALASLKRQGRGFRPPERFISLEERVGIIEEEAPIIKIVSILLKHGVYIGASDIHIEPMRTKLRVRYRIDGLLYSTLFLPLAIQDPIISRIKILSKLKIDETRIPQDGRFHSVIDKKEIDFRVSTFPTTVGEKVAIRILDPTIGLREIEELGLAGRSLEVVRRCIQKPFGMILATGPTGSGKTTTLYSILQILNKEEVNIVSLEDPVEYFVEGLNQSQIRPELGYTFARGLRHTLRQDPDVIMVGEIRDNETAALTTHAALTGHIVLSTLHTNNVIGVIPRLIDMEIEPFLLPTCLNLMLAQRLVSRLCPHCKKKVVASPRIQKVIQKNIDSLPEDIKKTLKFKPPFEIYQPQGCKKCAYKGVRGRIGLFEVMEMTPQLSEVIARGITEASLISEAKRQGMLSLRQDGILKALEGIVSVEAVMRETAEF